MGLWEPQAAAVETLETCRDLQGGPLLGGSSHLVSGEDQPPCISHLQGEYITPVGGLTIAMVINYSTKWGDPPSTSYRCIVINPNKEDL